jgi:hypothetical protein
VSSATSTLNSERGSSRLKKNSNFGWQWYTWRKALEWNVSPEEGEASYSKWEKNMAELLRSAAPDKAHITFGVELAGVRSP